MTVVVDASAVVAALVDAGPDGEWATAELLRDVPVAPHLMPVEAANILRRAVRSGALSADSGTLAHNDLLALPIELFPYQPLALRVWELRDNLTSYDACYVALAEALDAPFVTLDARIGRAAGVQCLVRLPSR